MPEKRKIVKAGYGEFSLKKFIENMDKTGNKDEGYISDKEKIREVIKGSGRAK